MVLEKRAQIAETLRNGINLYCDHSKKLLESQDSTKANIGARLALDFPSALLELGFFVGVSNWVKSAYQIDQTVSPTTEVNLCLINEVDRAGEFIFTMACYQKPAAEVAWQQWRLESIIKETYQQDDFPGYHRSECRNATTSTAIIRNNLIFSKKDQGLYKLMRGGRKLAFNFQTTNIKELPLASSFRYEYQIKFDQQIPEELVLLLPHVS